MLITDVYSAVERGIMLGSLMEDGLSYKEKFIVRSHEVQCNKTATVQTIANLLQVVAKCEATWKLLEDLAASKSIGSAAVLVPRFSSSVTLTLGMTFVQRFRECLQDDVVDSLITSKSDSAASGTQSHNDSQFLHLLRLSGDGQEINCGTTLRRKKPSR
ncbi:unnamed protein product [Eruca vesicaria subsp. sativa]|uniref:Uncharacterized protein n=1 Tax=Eruca vesicaria subsp. sativa TaxID=29727 RepID=A0ABC8IXV4_ERUVS|nr:unnamed protein product [Eruca vesicaria subsp. sativa]